MKKMLGNNRVQEYLFQNYGYHTFPLSHNSKVPPQGSRWRHTGWVRFANDRQNIGLKTGLASGVVVVDLDSESMVKEWWRTHPRPTTIVRTRNGYHFFYGCPVGVNPPGNRKGVGGHKLDIRGEGGYVVLPPSTADGWKYHYLPGFGPVPASEMPVYNPAWLDQYEYDRPSPKLGSQHQYQPNDNNGRWRRPESYIQHIRAVSGAGGHNQTWRVVSVLFESRIPAGDALEILRAWNATNADPPWSERELQHKVESRYQLKLS